MSNHRWHASGPMADQDREILFCRLRDLPGIFPGTSVFSLALAGVAWSSVQKGALFLGESFVSRKDLLQKFYVQRGDPAICL